MLHAQSISIACERVSSVLVSVAWQSGPLRLATAVLPRCRRRQAAATRHAVWATALSGLLLAPAFEVMLPNWELPVPPALFSAGTQVLDPVESPESTSVPTRT